MAARIAESLPEAVLAARLLAAEIPADRAVHLLTVRVVAEAPVVRVVLAAHLPIFAVVAPAVQVATMVSAKWAG